MLYLTRSEREVYEGRLKQLRDTNGQIAKARADGLTAGFEDGRQDGIQEGIVQGRQEGRQETIELVAKNLLKSGVDVQSVAEATGVGFQKIQQWLVSMRETVA